MKMRSAASPQDEFARFNWRTALLLVLQGLRESKLLEESIVLLTGSYAHGTQTEKSDIDVLVLRRGHPRRFRVPYGVHLKFENLDRFRNRVAEGDDFAIDALRFGELLYDGLELWQELRSALENAKWPDWRMKMRKAERRIVLADELLESGDLDAATEEFLLAATQIARAKLLRRGVYPMSRPQLSHQLDLVGEERLSADMQKLASDTSEENVLRQIAKDLTAAVSE